MTTPDASVTNNYEKKNAGVARKSYGVDIGRVTMCVITHDLVKKNIKEF